MVSRRIIIGYDSSPRSEDGLVLGRRLAEALDATPLAATVFRYPDHSMRDRTRAPELDPVAATRAPARLAPAGVEHVTLGYDQSPARALLRLAARERALAIVVGSAHLGTFGRLVKGSVAESVLAAASCAVAVAPDHYAEGRERGLERIGVVVDGSDESRVARAAADALARKLSASLTEVTIAEGANLASVLVAGVRELELLILGSRSHRAARRLGSPPVSVQLMGRTRCPTLVLPSAAGEDPLGLRPVAADRVA